MARKKRSVCPVACVLDLIGDRWTLLVVRDLACGKRHFHEFIRSPEGIATNILSDRLSRLVDEGLAERFPSPDAPGRDAYRLTARGKGLGPIIAAIADWGVANIEGTQAMIQPSFD